MELSGDNSGAGKLCSSIDGLVSGLFRARLRRAEMAGMAAPSTRDETTVAAITIHQAMPASRGGSARTPGAQSAACAP